MSKAIVKKAKEPEILKDLTDAEAAKLRERALSLRVTIEKDCLEQGRVLYDILHRNIATTKQATWRTWGFQSFDEYCETELGYRHRKAQHLINVFDQVSQGVLPEKALEQLGMFKVYKLAAALSEGVIQKDDVDKWIDVAAKKTADGLKSELRKARAEVQETSHETGRTVDEEIFHFSGSLYSSQKELWDLAMEKAKRITKSDKKPWLVECVVQHFLSEVCETPRDSIRVLMARMEQLYGAKIAAFDAKTGECLYGESLVAMAQDDVAEAKK